MIRTREIGKKFTMYGNTYIVEAVEDEKKPCGECHFSDSEGNCLAKVNVTGFCYKDFRKDNTQVRFRMVENFAKKCRKLPVSFDNSACDGAKCVKKYSCVRFMLGIKAKLVGYDYPVPYITNCGKEYKCYMDYRKL